LTFKYKSEVIGKNGISARVVAKSKSAYSDTILTCWEYDAPKCILAELNTHGILVRNAQSSRAVPIKKVIEQIRNNPVTPVHWGANQAGMVAGDEIYEFVQFNNDGHIYELDRDEAWKHSAEIVADLQAAWEEAGYHKQIVNRIGEAFTMVRGVISGTEIDNFFHLRYHPDADPYIQELARCMWEAYELAETEVLYEGEWHVPYVKTAREPEFNRRLYLQEVDPSKTGYGLHVVEDGIFYKETTVEEALRISAAACGQVSYRKLDLSEETVDRVWDRLMTGDIVHASVTGHQATPMKQYEWPQYCDPSVWIDHDGEGITHADRERQYWSAQFKHWIMHRKLIPNESFKGKFVPPTKNKSES
jgi:hypothetical protein